MTVPTRPVLRYHGGKWRLAPWILGFFPEHRVYVEPFGGAASVLMRKPRAYAEVYNDLADRIVNVFRVLRDPVTADALLRAIELTPYARVEFEALFEDCPGDSIEWARRIVARAAMGFGSGASNDSRPRGMRTTVSTWRPPTGFRANIKRSGTTPATDWRNYPEHVTAFVDRFRGVVVESRPAAQVIATHDGIETLHYVDPPYPHSTRNARRPSGTYEHEMTDDDHRVLGALLRGLRGMVVLSGYACDLYDSELFTDWERHEHRACADGARPRLEVVWLNPACSAALRGERSQMVLDGGAA